MGEAERAGTSRDLRSRCLVLFTKPARPGQVKTRLIGELTAAEAAQLHAAFLEDLTERLRKGRFALRVAWAVEPGDSLPPASVPAMRQRGADLGERLLGGLRAVAAEFPLVAAIGSDHPEIPLSRVQVAFDKLESGADVVLGPADDGGYYLIALRREVLGPEIFREIPWSSSQVFASTLARCRALQLAVELLPVGHDVDTPRDLRRLEASLRQDSDLEAPRTRQLLARWGRL